jgi:hypothetical protein
MDHRSLDVVDFKFLYIAMPYEALFPQLLDCRWTRPRDAVHVGTRMPPGYELYFSGPGRDIPPSFPCFRFVGTGRVVPRPVPS